MKPARRRSRRLQRGPKHTPQHPPSFCIGMTVGYTAVVTGGTGFLATQLVSQLLSKGYGVRATVRRAQSCLAIKLKRAACSRAPR